MEREEFLNSTRMMIILLKEFNNKLCKKGLLERTLHIKLFLGDFKSIENDFIRNILTSGYSITLLENLRKEKENAVNDEINKLKRSTEALSRSMNTIRENLRSKLDVNMYDVWSKRIDAISTRFKIMYSDINNDYYNHFYKMSKNTDLAWSKIREETQWLQEWSKGITLSHTSEKIMCVSCKNVINSESVMKNVVNMPKSGEKLCMNGKSMPKSGENLYMNGKNGENLSMNGKSMPKSEEKLCTKSSDVNVPKGSGSEGALSDNKMLPNIKDLVVGFEEGDLSELFSEDTPEPKPKPKPETDPEPETNKRKPETNKRKLNSKERERKRTKTEKETIFEPISDTDLPEDEGSCLNGLALVDEIGEVNLSEFEEIVKKFTS